MADISLCMIAYDEAEMLEDCLSSAIPVVSEIIIGIDSRTTDDTARIVAQFATAKSFTFEWNNNFSEARNQVVQKANNEWILSLDADERLTKTGQATIIRAITSAPDMDAFQLAMEHRTLDNTVIARDYHTRLFKSHLRYQFPVHEDVRGNTLCQIQATEAHIIHYGYDPKVFVDKHKLVRELEILEKWTQSEPYHPQPNYYLAKIMFARNRDSAASTYATVALRYGDSQPGALSDNQKNVLRALLAEYAPS